jgi:4-aminobutyrate aminotransferase-like enzyme/Ser/Thr protein kinase RdoA (MazF antagonist)
MVSDFASGFGMKRPQVDAAEATAVLESRFGRTGVLTELGSNQDRNFLVTGQDGIRHLLKIDNPVFRTEEIEAQLLGLRHLAARGLHVPEPVAALDGAFLQPLSSSDGTAYAARLHTFVEGVPLADAPRLGHREARRLGSLVAQIHLALADLDHPGLRRRLQWDMRHSAAVIEQLVSSVSDDELRARLRAAAHEAWARVSAVADSLPITAVHGDLTPDNVVRTGDDQLAAIDFGDLAHGWRVAEIAVTAAGVLTRSDGDAGVAISAIEAFLSRVTLTPGEIEALWPLVILRGCVLVVSGIHQAALDADNDYVADRLAEEFAVFETALGVDPVLVAATLASTTAADVDEAPAVRDGFAPMLGDVPVVLPEVTPESPVWNDGRWQDGAAARRRVIEEHAAPGVAVAIAQGVPDLSRSPALGATEPANVPLALALSLPAPRGGAGVRILAPCDARVEESGDHRLVLSFHGTRLQIDGVRSAAGAGASVARGSEVATAVGRDVRLLWMREGAPTPPAYAAEPWVRGWRRWVLDPAALLGMARPAVRQSPRAELDRKSRVFAAAQEHYFERPPLMVRGWGSLLIDSTGRSFLDMVNNVSSIGHSHPRLTAAVARQLATLNTNSRFLYPQIADLSERLLRTAPEGFDTVLLVNSGTEAVDLALKLATLYTGRRDVVALREGYHGWSHAADAVSTSAFDNPHALSSRPDWVHIAEAPNTYRGVHRGTDSGPAYLDDLRRLLSDLSDAGRPPAAYIAEPVLGNAGGVMPPAGYVRGAYEAVRSHGGVVISDEVQVGLGRLGPSFWGCVHEGAVPDIIVSAKALGNVYPVGAVLTRREIADALGREGQFFSSAGGAPASCAAALAVLDVIEHEDLAGNALRVGAELRGWLEELAERRPLIGALHGTALYQGVELVTDRETRAPAVTETIAVCERMRELGVIVQPASERQNVLKIKPSLGLTREQAAYFVWALDRALEEHTAR